MTTSLVTATIDKAYVCDMQSDHTPESRYGIRGTIKFENPSKIFNCHFRTRLVAGGENKMVYADFGYFYDEHGQEIVVEPGETLVKDFCIRELRFGQAQYFCNEINRFEFQTRISFSVGNEREINYHIGSVYIPSSLTEATYETVSRRVTLFPGQSLMVNARIDLDVGEYGKYKIYDDNEGDDSDYDSGRQPIVRFMISVQNKGKKLLRYNPYCSSNSCEEGYLVLISETEEVVDAKAKQSFYVLTAAETELGFNSSKFPFFLDVSEGSFYLLESNEIAMGFEFFDVYDNYIDFDEEFGDEDFERVREVKEWQD